MKLYVTLILLSNFLVNINTAPIETEDPELTAGYYEGDMIMQTKRNGIIDVSNRWPLGMVYYKLDEVFDNGHISYIQQAMAAIESVSCVRFLHAANDTLDYIMITGNPDGCYAAVGYRGVNQTLNLQVYDLDKGCFIKGKIMHELMHALGFFHQHNVPTRDEYITLMMENIKDKYQPFFRKQRAEFVTDFGIEYDYDSIMHYNSMAFSKNGQKTIIPLQSDVQIGQRRGLSTRDILKLNLMYNCSMAEQ